MKTPAGRTLRLALPYAAAAVGLAGAALAWGPPRLLWLNLGPRLDYPWPRGAAALIAAIAAAILAVALRARLWRTLGLITALIALVWSLSLFVYRMDAGEHGLSLHRLTGSTVLAWKEVTRVDLDPDRVAVHGKAEVLQLSTTGLPGEDRARLERTISRRVREASVLRPPEPPGGSLEQ